MNRDREAIARIVWGFVDDVSKTSGRTRQKWVEGVIDRLAALPATAQEFYHPEPVVMFRAGLLACREYMARFVEQGGDAATAASIRANWWPALGDDPGAPRLFDYSELVTETGDEATPFISHTPPVNREAAVEAHVFLHHVAAGTLMPYREAAAPPQAPVAGSEDPASEERERIARITARGEEPSVADWEMADMILGGFTWEGKGHV